MTQPVFMLDGVRYNVAVSSLKRTFAVLDSGKSGRTQDGEMYRDVIGTYYNYEMTIRRRGTDAAALDALWTAVSQPTVAHVCTFPYGQGNLTQRMYCTSGEQSLRLLGTQGADWGELTVRFIAMSPRVTP